MPETQTIQPFDRTYGDLHNVSLSTKATTIKHVQPVTGRSESYIVQTFRHADLGDYIFIEALTSEGLVRLALPPKVAAAIASQRDALTKRRRSISSKATMRARMESGEWKGFGKQK